MLIPTQGENGLFLLRCPHGHEWADQIPLPMPLNRAATYLADMDCCPTCQTPGAVLLQDEAFRVAKARLCP